MNESSQVRPRLLSALLVGFGVQVAGRLVDLQWHLTHEQFEGGVEQLQAHWLIWLSTIFVIGVAAIGARDVREPGERRGYMIVLVANLSYAVVSVIHFFQHLDHREVDWAHLLLAITTVVAAVGVLWVIGVRLSSRRADKEAVA